MRKQFTLLPLVWLAQVGNGAMSAGLQPLSCEEIHFAPIPLRIMQIDCFGDEYEYMGLNMA
jgi:hypothetical protein